MGKISEKIVGWTGQEEKEYNGLAVYPILNSRKGGYHGQYIRFPGCGRGKCSGILHMQVDRPQP